MRAFAIVAAAVAALVFYRAVYVEPREWGALCAAAAPPLACGPRDVLLWLQYEYLWGLGGLVLGVWAFVGAPRVVGPAAVAIGAMAVINYNATWGMLGAALGAWAWLVRRDARG